MQWLTFQNQSNIRLQAVQYKATPRYAISLLPCAIVYFVLTMYCCNLTRLRLGMLPVCFTCALPSIYIIDSALAVYTIGTRVNVIINV